MVLSCRFLLIVVAILMLYVISVYNVNKYYYEQDKITVQQPINKQSNFPTVDEV